MRWEAGAYERDGGFVADLAGPVLALLAPQPGERILDLGCGDGRLTARLGQLGASVIGIDAAPALVAAARARGCDTRLLDGHALDYDAAFDAVFSNAALHWMTDPAAVARGVHRALRPGGRFVAEMGGFGNVAAIRTALAAALAPHGVTPDWPATWYFPTAEAHAALLNAAGFRIETAELVPRLTRLDAGMEAWIALFVPWLLDPLPPETRREAVATATALLAPILRDESGTWHADYIRLRFRAVRT